VPAHIKAAVGRNKDAAELRASHEEAVGGQRRADASLLAAYTAYIAVRVCIELACIRASCTHC
jgi:hypothetical protein